ncbi:hypothetical protein FQN50_009980 [Emmonsiellopsis sp. PD_5]|nr:hypothetical protein FQN50_009980 [Emmonsiellopsis sp. PD_5]
MEESDQSDNNVGQMEDGDGQIFNMDDIFEDRENRGSSGQHDDSTAAVTIEDEEPNVVSLPLNDGDLDQPLSEIPLPHTSLSILAHRLAEQLQQHHGCMGSSHKMYPFDIQLGNHPPSSRATSPSTMAPSQPVHSVRLSEIVQWDCPDILSQPKIAEFGEPWNEHLSPSQRRKIFCGLDGDIGSNHLQPPTVDIASDELPSGPLLSSIDIDSAGGFASSLAVAKAGIHWLAVRPPVSSLQAGLHLSPIPVTWYATPDALHPKCTHSSIHQIPHLPLGRLGGFNNLELYALFPQLYHPDHKHFIISNEEWNLWMDKVMLPCLHKCYSPALLGHIPSSASHMQLNATARSAEGHVRHGNTIPRIQHFHHFLPSEELSELWQEIQAKIQTPGLHQFQGVKLFLTVKNTKLLTQSHTWMETHLKFFQQWEHAVNSQFMNEEFFDIGKEVCPPQSYLAGQEADQVPGTLLWRQCCMQSFAQHCQNWLPKSITSVPDDDTEAGSDLEHMSDMEDDSYIEDISDNDTDDNITEDNEDKEQPDRDEQDQEHSNSPQPQGDTSPFHQEFYPMSFLSEAGSLTLETRPKSALRQSGLLYCQFYNTIKEVFAAGNHYTFGAEHLDTLTLDPGLIRTWQHIGRVSSHSPYQTLRAYLHTKQCCYEGLKGSKQKAFAVREEYRVSGDLLRAIHTAIQDQGWADSPLPCPVSLVRPFYHQPTSLIMHWLQWNVNRLCMGFEMVYSLRQGNVVQWEHTCVMMMFLQCLQYMYGGQGGHLRHSNGLWLDYVVRQSKHDREGPGKIQEGMGFQRNLQQYQYAWMCDKLDWTAMVFKPEHRANLTFNTPTLQQAFHHHYREVHSAKQDFLLIQDLLARMRESATNLPQAHLLLQLCIDVCLQAFRKDVFMYLDNVKQFPWQWNPQQKQKALAGKIMLTWAGLQSVFPELTSPEMIHAVAGNNMSVRSISVLFAWLWGWDGDGSGCLLARAHWENKPYRLLFQQCFSEVGAVFGLKQAWVWQANLRSTFIRTHWLLPYPSEKLFWKRHEKQFKWWSSIHSGVQEYVWERKRKDQGPLDSAIWSIEPWEVVHLPLRGWEYSSSVMQEVDIRLPIMPASVDDFLANSSLEPGDDSATYNQELPLPLMGQSTKLIYSITPDIMLNCQLRSNTQGEYKDTLKHDPEGWQSHCQSYLQRLIRSKRDSIQSLNFANHSRHWQHGTQLVHEVASTEPDSNPESLNLQYVQETKELQALEKQEKMLQKYSTKYMYHWRYVKSLEQQDQRNARRQWDLQEHKDLQNKLEWARQKRRKYSYHLRETIKKICK